jgi:hypothetical protein
VLTSRWRRSNRSTTKWSIISTTMLWSISYSRSRSKSRSRSILGHARSQKLWRVGGMLGVGVERSGHTRFGITITSSRAPLSTTHCLDNNMPTNNP